MPALLVLVAMLPPLLLLLGLGLGAAGARWWWICRAAALRAASSSGIDEETAAVTAAVPLATLLPAGRKASSTKRESNGAGAIHIMASCAATRSDAVEAPLPAMGLRVAAPPPPALSLLGGELRLAPSHTSDSMAPADALACDTALAEEQLRSLVGARLGGGSGSLSPSHRKTASMDFNQLLRAGPSVIAQAVEEWENRNTIFRLLSMDAFGSGQHAPPSPSVGGRLSSPMAHHAAALFSPGGAGAGVGPGGERPMPPGEVHMDEIDLLDCIGKGGYGCVYKASWRGAGVAVKYIVCPTDDVDSLGRAIREVVLSKKMSHPNVVQCYSWTVLTESDNRQPTTASGPCSGASTPREQSFTSRRRNSVQRGSPDMPAGARRVLDQRFLAAAGSGHSSGCGSPGRAASPSALHCIAEESHHASQHDFEGQPFTVAAATEQQAGNEAGCSRQVSPEVEVAAAGGGKPLAKLLPAASGSPGSSPGIQAEYAPGLDGEAATAQPSEGRASRSPAPAPFVREAFSLEPRGSLPSSPFASRAARPQPTPRTCSFGEGAEPQGGQLLLEAKMSSEAEAEQFGSYDEMLVHLQQLAAEEQLDRADGEGQRQLEGGEGEQPVLAAAAARAAAASAFDVTLADFSVTAASSFSDVLSTSGFMLEGSAHEVAVLSQPTSPRHAHHQPPPPPLQQHQRAGPFASGPWTLPSSAPSSRPATPRGTAAAAAHSGLAPQHLQPSRFAIAAGIERAASLPMPAWHAAGGEQQQAALPAPAPAATSPRAAVDLTTAASSPLPSSSGTGVQQHVQQQRPPSPDLAPASSGTVAATWSAGYAAAAEQAACSSSSSQEEEQQPAHQRQKLCLPSAACPAGSGPAVSGSVTPRVCSLSNLGPGGAEGSPQVTPRALQLTPRADSVRSTPGRSPGSASGLQRLEELRSGGGAGHGGGSGDRVSLGSHQSSFNSEEGFGSPVKQRRGGVKDVFQLEELRLAGQEALMAVVMEYCDLGSLRKALQRKAFRPSAKWPFQTTYRALLRTAQEVAKGMGYIHEFNIVHGDLKPGNVLLKTHKVDRRGYIAKVSDFGLSRPLDAEFSHASMVASAVGTIAYCAPESFAHNSLRKESDVYAFGVMLWEMFYCEEPYEGLIDAQICLGVSDGILRPDFRDDCPAAYRRLAERCWHQDPEQRPSFEEADRELVRIEMEFRRTRHRTASKRASSAQSAGAEGGGGSLPASRPASPARRQLQAAAIAD